MVAQDLHAMHSSMLMQYIGWYPLELIPSDSANIFLGHTSTQRPQALHLSAIISIFPLIAVGI
jgi:hypothetical protein